LFSFARSKSTTADIGGSGQPIEYSQLIEKALKIYGGRATFTDICEYIEQNFNEHVASKKTWRNSIASRLSMYHEKQFNPENPKLWIWTLQKKTKYSEMIEKKHKKRRRREDENSDLQSTNTPENDICKN